MKIVTSLFFAGLRVNGVGSRAHFAVAPRPGHFEVIIVSATVDVTTMISSLKCISSALLTPLSLSKDGTKCLS